MSQHHVEGISAALGASLGRFVAFPFDSLQTKEVSGGATGSSRSGINSDASSSSSDTDSTLASSIASIPDLFNGASISCVQAAISKGIQMSASVRMKGMYKAAMTESDSKAVVSKTSDISNRNGETSNNNSPSSTTSSWPKKEKKQQLPVYVSTIIGYLAYFVALPVIIVFDNLVVAVQTNNKSTSTSSSVQSEKTFAIVARVLREEILTKDFVMKKLVSSLPAYLVLGWKPGLELACVWRLKEIALATMAARSNRMDSERKLSQSWTRVESDEARSECEAKSNLGDSNSGELKSEKTDGKTDEAIRDREENAEKSPKTTIKTKENNLPPYMGFVIGFIGRAVATLIMYPYHRVKILAAAARKESSTTSSLTSQQTSSTSGSTLTGQQNLEQNLGMFAILSSTLEKQGIRGLYTGLFWEFVRGTVQAAIQWMMMESVRNSVRKVLGG